MGVEKITSSLSQLSPSLTTHSRSHTASGWWAAASPPSSSGTWRRSTFTISSSRICPAYRGGQESHTKTEPKQQMWRNGDTRGPGSGARDCQEEVPQPPDGGHPHLVPVQDQGVRSSN